MLSLLFYLFIGKKLCDHKWNIMKDFETGYYDNKNDLPTKRTHTWEMKCDTCGKIKVVKKEV